MVNIQQPFLASFQDKFAAVTTPDPGIGNNLFTFLCNRFLQSLPNLGCQNQNILVKCTLDGNGAPSAARLATTSLALRVLQHTVRAQECVARTHTATVPEYTARMHIARAPQYTAHTHVARVLGHTARMYIAKVRFQQVPPHTARIPLQQVLHNRARVQLQPTPPHTARVQSQSVPPHIARVMLLSNPRHPHLAPDHMVSATTQRLQAGIERARFARPPQPKGNPVPRHMMEEVTHGSCRPSEEITLLQQPVSLA